MPEPIGGNSGGVPIWSFLHRHPVQLVRVKVLSALRRRAALAAIRGIGRGALVRVEGANVLAHILRVVTV
jgi:hypothetical protein